MEDVNREVMDNRPKKRAKRTAMGDQENRAQMEELNPEVTDEMFLFIPLERLMKFKIASRTLLPLITDFRRRHTPITHNGLVVVLRRVLRPNRHFLYDESIFRPHPQGQDPRSITLIRQRQPLDLRGSCNGILLYDAGGYDFIVDNVHRQQVYLSKHHEYSRHRHARVGLAYEGVGSNFRLLYFFYEEIENGLMNCELYSSETNRWNLFPARIHNIVAMGEGFNREAWFGTSLYFDGRLYWIWSICMLRYDIGSKTFTLFPLPPESNGKSAQLLYESDGRIYFCYLSYDSLNIFAFGDDYKWEPRTSVSRRSDRWSEFRPYAFNQDLQQLILFVPPRTIVYYSLETDEFEQECLFEEVEVYTTEVKEILPLLFKSVPSSSILWKRID